MENMRFFFEGSNNFESSVAFVEAIMYKGEGKEGQNGMVAEVCLGVCMPVHMVWSG